MKDPFEGWYRAIGRKLYSRKEELENAFNNGRLCEARAMSSYGSSVPQRIILELNDYAASLKRKGELAKANYISGLTGLYPSIIEVSNEAFKRQWVGEVERQYALFERLTAKENE